MSLKREPGCKTRTYKFTVKVVNYANPFKKIVYTTNGADKTIKNNAKITLNPGGIFVTMYNTKTKLTQSMSYWIR